MAYWRKTFEGLPERLADVRHFVGRVLHDAPGADDVVLIASELAANAIRHSASGEPGGAFTVHVVTFSDHWHIRVDDLGGKKSPKPGKPAEQDEAGRGLPVVDALAHSWGVLGDHDGRVVWASVAFPVDEVRFFQEGDVVRVRDEPDLSIIVQPPHAAASCLPAETPELSICCVPVTLVRTMTPDDPEGLLRWVEAAELRKVTAECPA